MKVKPSELASKLTMTPAAITMAVTRGKLNKTLDGLIDLDDSINHAWIIKRLTKQGCEIPQKISALFKATPLTEDGKSDKKNNGGQQAPAEGGDRLPESAEDNAERERQAAAKQISRNQLIIESSKAREAKSRAAISEMKEAHMRRELIQINPFARFLFNIRSAERSRILNAVPNIAQLVMDEIKSALNENKSDTEILMQIKKTWQGELSIIYEAADRELKSKIRQARDKLSITDDDEDESEYTEKEVAENVA